MKRNQGLILAGVVLLAACAGWWAWRPAGTSPMSDDATGSLAAESPVPRMDGPGAGASAPAHPAGDHSSRIATSDTGSAATMPAPVVPRDANAGAAPRPITPEGEARIEALLAGLRRTDDATARDYELLARSEPSDPDTSPRLESLIQQVIDRHARDLGQLDITRPRCSKSLCMLAAVSHVPQTRHAQADYSRLTGHMFAEPWFREAFFDQRTTVHGDRQGVVYVSYFIRK
ncbi:hypothetical protein MMG85_00470 [Pseudoxanthomonas sp. LH2527]|uniref:hypothetical protein n=1 Tax=Pseudoxanthomonas sp. LH2527 TaxID=2923249 RepID=UPI001F12C2AA|nr:hypothetical protein [Pseudoxanthomonas sp. LH2527]MCH6482045.1 hypothetical protein [Pseudoxanthomonas sp. LH2527]